MLQEFQFSPSSLLFPKKCSFLPKIGGVRKAFELNGFETLSEQFDRCNPWYTYVLGSVIFF